MYTRRSDVSQAGAQMSKICHESPHPDAFLEVGGLKERNAEKRNLCMTANVTLENATEVIFQGSFTFPYLSPLFFLSLYISFALSLFFLFLLISFSLSLSFISAFFSLYDSLFVSFCLNESLFLRIYIWLAFFLFVCI
jgi:hypothetical protein